MNDVLLKKIPSWATIDGIQYPPRLSLEQCSSEITALYKSHLLSSSCGGSKGEAALVDLTGGFGVDTAFLAPDFSHADYVEQQSGLVEIAAHNFSVLGLPVRTHVADAVDYLQAMSPVDCIYLDPARRDGAGKKVMRIANCSPDVAQIQDLLLEKAPTVLIKLSPMLDIHAALNDLNHVAEIHVVSVDNECKELLFMMKRDFAGEPPIICVNLVGATLAVAHDTVVAHDTTVTHDTATTQQGQGQGQALPLRQIKFYYSGEQSAVPHYCESVKKYLYEPNVAILKAGFFKGIATRYKVEKLHPNSHLYTSHELISDFPGRIFEVESQAKSLSKNSLREFLKESTAGAHPGGRPLEQANITTRNFPMSTAGLRKKLRLKEGGDVYLFATTIGKKAILIKTKKTVKS
ncbi:MAG: SAM-dependent methyltransferase [Candidatus Symbiothrix sp.]|jgi:hypothetical protein|nr:SAM-dependent methyltransferase [Candidatus Symbiothrix sp.]